MIYFFITSTIVNAASCYELSNSYKYYSTESTRFFDLYLATSYKDTELRNEYLTRYNQYKTLSSTTYSEYLDCKVRISGIFDKGYDATAL